MQRVTSVADLRLALAEYRSGQTIGLVPTMGALHEAHGNLMRRSLAENTVTVVSVFVNPLQFAPTEDLAQYPRQLEQDCQFCQRLGVPFVFTPSAQALGLGQENRPLTRVTPPPSMLSVLCGPFRPGHFIGVATIVTKLLNLVQPTTAYFGQKDAQQLAIIQRLVIDLNLPVKIQPCPIVREASGLALSSRNHYLSDRDREQAVALFQSLQLAKAAFEEGDRDGPSLISRVKDNLEHHPSLQVEYVELVHPQTLERLAVIDDQGLLAIAAYLGSTRLIDNVILGQRQPIIAIDGPAGAGKSTVTRRVAQALGLVYLDTGAMYRALTWLVMEAGIPLNDETAIAQLVHRANIELKPADVLAHPTEVFINGQRVTPVIRQPAVTANVSQIAAQGEVRRALVTWQQHYGQQGGLVAEGRDIGTHVFPDAELKIFLTATAQERARRRLKDLQAQGHSDMNLSQLEQVIQQRDKTDSHRAIAPLQKATDAIEVMTDGMAITDVVEKIVTLYYQKGLGNPAVTDR